MIGWVSWIYILLIAIVLVFVAPNQYAESSHGNTNVVLYSKDYTTAFDVGQVVKLAGTVIQDVTDRPSGLTHVHYQIIDADTRSVIHDDYTDDQGLFYWDWTANTPSGGSGVVRLVAYFPGAGEFDSSESPPLVLTIISIAPPVTYHTTQLTLQVKDGSSPGTIQVEPGLTMDSGGLITTPDISISIDGNNVVKVQSNQWSADISVGSGTYTIVARYPQESDNNNSNVFYKTSTDSKYYTVGNAGTYYNTHLSLQVRDGSSPGTIQVEPGLTMDSGGLITTPDISISIDGNNVVKVQSNQWSQDISAGSGTHNIVATYPQESDNNNSNVFYKTSTDSKYYTLTTSYGPIINSTSMIYIIVVLILIGTGIVIGLLKRKKSIHVANTSPVTKSPQIVPISPVNPDDTQFYGCPYCGSDTQIQYGKQYCNKCRMYL
ncbi:MAG: hypothetical protein ACREAD_02090 [Nitrosopumilaceae archaeon]